MLSYAIDAGARAELLHRAARAQQVTTFARERYLDVVMDVLWKVVRNSSSWSDDWQWRKHRLLREVLVISVSSSLFTPNRSCVASYVVCV